MSRSFLRTPSPAMAVALTALFMSLGGTGYAATQLSNSPAGTVAKAKKKKLAPSDTSSDKKLFNSLIPSAHVAFASTAGSAATAGSATTAGTATTANHALTADSATNATNATQLGGQSASAYALTAQPAFTPATLETGFSNLSIGYSEAGFMKDTLGYVHLRGTMSCPENEHTAFVLPAGFRPATTLFLPLAVGSSGAGNLQVFANGNVNTFLPGGAHACGIDGLSFKAEQ